jgi:hypothetical protein
VLYLRCEVNRENLVREVLWSVNRKSLLIAPILLTVVLGMLAAPVVANGDICHPVEARGFAVVRLSRCCWIAGRATLEIYEFNSADHPGGMPHPEPVVVWVAKLTVRRLNAYWVIGDVEFDGSKVKVCATGHAWTWNGMKLSGAPPDIEITVWHTRRFWTWASGNGLLFFGKGS